MIKEIDYNKYLVLKIEDLDRYFSQFTSGIFTTDKEQKFMDNIPFSTVLKEIEKIRKSENKKDNKYLVLNVDDEISINELIKLISDRCKKLEIEDYYNVPIKVISTDIINAILKLKS